MKQVKFKVNLDNRDFDFPNPMKDILKQIAEKQSELFDKTAIESLNIKALLKLYELTITELKLR
jgi:hypothetical protein